MEYIITILVIVQILVILNAILDWRHINTLQRAVMQLRGREVKRKLSKEFKELFGECKDPDCLVHGKNGILSKDKKNEDGKNNQNEESEHKA